jgi:hypothetical protein
MAVRQSEDFEDQLEAIADLTTPEDALAWCKANGTTFVYMPSAPSEEQN